MRYTLGTEPDTGAGTGEPPRLQLGRGWGCESVRGGRRSRHREGAESSLDTLSLQWRRGVAPAVLVTR